MQNYYNDVGYHSNFTKSKPKWTLSRKRIIILQIPFPGTSAEYQFLIVQNLVLDRFPCDTSPFYIYNYSKCRSQDMHFIIYVNVDRNDEDINGIFLLYLITLYFLFLLVGIYYFESPVLLSEPNETNHLSLHQILCNRLCPAEISAFQYEPQGKPEFEREKKFTFHNKRVHNHNTCTRKITETQKENWYLNAS